ncbi:hypothetical protein C1H46_038860 [Malus baccata]|uniref:RanBP2-type domain-containing protein n=1 Tax=Malus baccata TaxID=106549 RepID=A0A540KN56_MALBA|nr:hypothetical protein C1H46_038860 [Malus baccata]
MTNQNGWITATKSVYDDEDTGFVEEEDDDDNEAANEFGNVQEDNIDTDDQPKQNNSLLKEDDVWQQRLELKFIIEAWQQIIEARQILRWSYAYGYYIPEDELLKLKLFEHLLGHAVFSLERLTNATANYFDKLVRALESGLSEINPNYGNYWACDRCTYINQGSATTCAVCAGNMSEPEF